MLPTSPASATAPAAAATSATATAFDNGYLLIVIALKNRIDAIAFRASGLPTCLFRAFKQVIGAIAM